MYLGAQNCVEPRLHIIADNNTLTMYCGKRLGGYWYGNIPASDIATDVHGICEECKQAVKQRNLTLFFLAVSAYAATQINVFNIAVEQDFKATKQNIELFWMALRVYEEWGQ